MEFQANQKFGKMTRAFARLKRINEDTGHHISNTDARDAVEDFVNHAYHLKDYLKEEFPEKRARIEAYITGSRILSLIADLQNSFKHAADVKTRRERHEGQTGAPSIGALVRINTHTKLDLKTWTWSQQLVLTFENATFDGFELAQESIAAWDAFLAAEGIVLERP